MLVVWLAPFVAGCSLMVVAFSLGESDLKFATQIV